MKLKGPLKEKESTGNESKDRKKSKKSLFIQHESKAQQDCANMPDDMVSREGNNHHIVLGEPRLSINLRLHKTENIIKTLSQREGEKEEAKS